MKAPAFWYQPEGAAARWLAPLSYGYRLAASLRRAFAKPYQASVPVMCIGNVVAGGAGKTPTALALAALLKSRGHKPVFVTRGYGGSQRGPLRVDAAHHSAAVGDEALLLLRQAPVWIGRDRAAAIRKAQLEATHIILDDGLQNPNIKPDIALLVMDGAVGLGNGHIIPAGPLREAFAEALARVNAVLVIDEQTVRVSNGVPLPLREGLGEGSEVRRIPEGAVLNLHPHTPHLTSPARGEELVRFLQKNLVKKPILHAHLEPAIPADFPRTARFLAFAGIGRPEKFYALCRKEGLTLAATQDFPDHHFFTDSELQDLLQKAKSLNARLLTTEKDFVRLPPALQPHVLTCPVALAFEDVTTVEALLYSRTTPTLPS